VALIDAGEPDHEACRQVIAGQAAPMLTTWPAFTEAIYLLGDAGGWPAQKALWQMIERGALEVEDLSRESVARVRALMYKYRDVPMDLAGASLVALAEERALKRICTLDSDFRIYKLRGRASFELVPG
jgi:predicted nucleic acid-binding protein